MAGTFRPTRAKLRYFWSAVGDIFTRVASATPRYPGALGFDSIAITPTYNRVSREGTIIGDGSSSEPESLPGSIGAGPVPFTFPSRADIFNLGLYYSLFSAAKTPEQLNVSTAFKHVIDDSQTDIVLSGATDRALIFQFDKTGDLIEQWDPAKVMSIGVTVGRDSTISSEVNLLTLGFRHYDDAVIETGTPGSTPIIRNYLNDDADAVVVAERVLNLLVFGAPTGAGTAADPKVVTFKADLGSSPVFGAFTFTVTCGLSDEGFPRWTSVLDSASLPGDGDHLGSQDSGTPLQIAILDVAATGFADLDEFSYAIPVPEWVPVLTTEPEFASVQACLNIDGSVVESIDTFAWVLANDKAVSEGGFCRAFPGSFFFTGNVVSTFAIGRQWLTDRHQRKITNSTKFDLLLTVETGIVIDVGVSTDTYKMLIEAPNCRIDSGINLKSFPGGATDIGEALTLRSHPDATIGGASVRVTIVAAVADALVA